jgi:hypothetical protein
MAAFIECSSEYSALPHQIFGADEQVLANLGLHIFVTLLGAPPGRDLVHEQYNKDDRLYRYRRWRLFHNHEK